MKYKVYLFFYNAIETLGWLYILYQLVDYYLMQSQEYCESVTLWNHIRIAVIVFQNAAFLEILHAAFGLVKSNVMLTTFQVFSRIMVVLGVVIPTADAKETLGLPMALLAWSITEIIRYGYYALNLINFVPHVVVFLRYTLFLVLYPLGVTGELLCYWAAAKYAKATSLWSYAMPNKYNFIFSYHILLYVFMLSYIPLFPQLYLHMINQRRKILGDSGLNKTTSKRKVK